MNIPLNLSLKTLLPGLTLAAVLGLSTLAPVARAQPGLDATYLGTTAVTGGTQYNYSLTFTSYNYAGAPPNVIDNIQSGDFITFYDVSGLVSQSATAGANFTSSVALLGQNPPGIPAGNIHDSVAIPNVIFTYNGPSVTAGTFTGFSFVSTLGATGSLNYNDQYHSFGSGRAPGPGGSVVGPGVPAAVPEPSSLTALGFGCLGLSGLVIAKKRKAASKAA